MDGLPIRVDGGGEREAWSREGLINVAARPWVIKMIIGSVMVGFGVTSEESIPIDWNERASRWDAQPETHIYAAQAFSLLGPVVAREFGTWGELRVLDFGAGTGLLTEKLAARCSEVVAIDSAHVMIRVLNEKFAETKHRNVITIAGSLTERLRERHPDLRRSFDLIVASSVCTFLPDFSEQLTLLAKMIRPGGLFVHWDWHASAGDWAKGFTVAEVEGAYRTAALHLVSCGVGFDFTFGDCSYEVLMGIARR